MKILAGLSMVILTILIIILGGLLVLAIFVYFKGKAIWKEFFGNRSVSEVKKERDYEAQNVPKTVSHGENIFMNQISRDFPEFSWNEYKMRSKNALKGALLAISNHDKSQLVKDCNDAMKRKVDMTIEDDNAGGYRTHYDDITVHDCGIVDYIKKNGQCIIKLQLAVGMKKWIEEDGKIIKGSKDVLTQTKFNLELIYVQDIYKTENFGDGAIGMNCPNCGAPIRNLNHKHCEYCGTAVIEVNIKIWNFGDFSERG